MSARSWPSLRPAWALGAAAAAVAALALLPGELGALAARAGLATCGIGALALLARRWRTGKREAPALQLHARIGLGRSGSVALLEVEGRRFLVGFGDGAPALLAELAPASGTGRATHLLRGADLHRAAGEVAP